MGVFGLALRQRGLTGTCARHGTQQMAFEEYMERLNRDGDILIDTTKPLRLYLRSAELLYKQGAVYLHEDNLEKAYTLFLKFSNLVLSEVPKHPDVRADEHQASCRCLKAVPTHVACHAH